MGKMDMLLSPLIVFVIYFVLVYLIYLYGKSRAAKEQFHRAGKTKVFACGEDMKGIQPQVSYREFFVYAMFFTILHVTALILGTISEGSIWLAVTYLMIISLGLYILVRRERV